MRNDPGQKDRYACRVCGLHQDDPPWGLDGQTPTYDICAWCGTEFGYEDITDDGIARARAAWISRGMDWFDPRYRPDDETGGDS